MDIRKIREAHAKIGAEAIIKSNTNGTLGLSYLIPVLPDENKFSSFIVVPVARQSRAWLSSCTIAPGKRNPLTVLLFMYFFHNSEVA